MFFRRTLSNGVRVIGEVRELPVVSLSITNEFGASHETADIKGIAHVIEHMVFTGTKTRSHEDISREIEKKGGIINAFTSDSVTSFWFKLPSEHLNAGLDILTDILNNPTFDEKKFEKEKKVILEEIKMYHDAPQYHIYEKINENLYEKPFGIGVIGTKETVSNLKRNFVADYFKQKYSPENYIVTFVGKVDPEKLCAYLEKKFKRGNRNSTPQKIQMKNAKSVENRQGLDQAHYMFAIHAPLATSPDIYAFEVMDAFLANGMSSHLFLTIREARGLAYTIKSMLDAKKDYAYYAIYVGTRKEAIPEVEKLIRAGFERVKKMTPKELAEAKQRLIGLKVISREESSEVMNELMFAEIRSRAEDYYAHEQRIQKVTLEQVKKVTDIKLFSTAAIVPA